MNSEALCETCLERGRVRKADVVTENLQMCRDCYDGKPTCREELLGGQDPAIAARKRRYKMKRRQLYGSRPRGRPRRLPPASEMPTISEAGI
jgi:hypothetical protein